MKVLICGSRSWTANWIVQDYIDNLYEKHKESLEIIVGDASRGVDSFAYVWARKLGLSITKYKADWKQYGKAAGMKRNSEMIYENPDLVVAFWDGASNGTKDTIDKAAEKNIPTEVYTL